MSFHSLTSGSGIAHAAKNNQPTKANKIMNCDFHETKGKKDVAETLTNHGGRREICTRFSCFFFSFGVEGSLKEAIC
jgi:hypothetical protein